MPPVPLEHLPQILLLIFATMTKHIRNWCSSFVYQICVVWWCVVVCGCVSVISVTNPVRLRSRMCQKEVFLLWNLQGGSNYTSAEEIRSEYLLRFLDTNKHIGFTGLEFGDKKNLLGLRQMEKTLWGAPMLRHGKSRKHASNACGQFLRKLWTFCVKQQFSCNFHPSLPPSLHYYPQLMHFCLKISNMKLQF